jgi:hypothetical protein
MESGDDSAFQAGLCHDSLIQFETVFVFHTDRLPQLFNKSSPVIVDVFDVVTKSRAANGFLGLFTSDLSDACSGGIHFPTMPETGYSTGHHSGTVWADRLAERIISNETVNRSRTFVCIFEVLCSHIESLPQLFNKSSLEKGSGLGSGDAFEYGSFQFPQRVTGRYPISFLVTNRV